MIDVGHRRPHLTIQVLGVPPDPDGVSRAGSSTPHFLLCFPSDLLAPVSNDRTCLIHDRLDVVECSLQRSQVNLCFKRRPEVMELPTTELLCDPRGTKEVVERAEVVRQA